MKKLSEEGVGIGSPFSISPSIWKTIASWISSLTSFSVSPAAIQPGKSGKDLKDVYEIRVDYDTNTYRAVYVINLNNRVFMLHVFKKKSKKGIETPKSDMNVIQIRLKQAKKLAKELDNEQRKS